MLGLANLKQIEKTMSNSYRKLIHLSTLLLVAGTLSACAGKKIELDRTVFETQKVEVVRINQLGSILTAEKSNSGKKVGLIGGVAGVLIGSAVDANTNKSRAKKLTPLAQAMGEYDVNQKIIESLQKQLKGNAFNEQLRLDTNFDPKDKVKPYLVPRVSPSVVMAADYASISVVLNVVTYQNKEGKRPHKEKYSAEYILDSQGEKVNKEDNFQFWSDNPELLKENISATIDEAVSKFANDFNLANNIQG